MYLYVLEKTENEYGATPITLGVFDSIRAAFYASGCSGPWQASRYYGTDRIFLARMSDKDEFYSIDTFELNKSVEWWE